MESTSVLWAILRQMEEQTKVLRRILQILESNDTPPNPELG